MRKPRITVVTLGCSKNTVDSEVLLGQLVANQADVVDDVDRFTKKENELLAAYVEHPPPTTILILTAAGVDFRKKPYNT